jgi:hypothetical protein
VSTIQVAAADQINAIIWNAYPWRWSQKAITPISLVDGTQDYSFAPSDLFRLVQIRLVDTLANPHVYDELTVLRNLYPDLTKASFRGGLKNAAYVPATSKVRLNQAAAVPTGNTYEIQGEYQYQPTKITATSATFPFPDQYFMVFNAGLLWQFFMLSKDDRAGNVQFTKNGAVYTGQMGVFFDALMAMREAEDWGAGDTIFPADPLGISGAGRSSFSIYGP